MKGKKNWITLASLIALVGFILSGPAGFLLVQTTKPQPAWVSPEQFVANYHPLQNLPYYFGFILVSGMIILVAVHNLNAKVEKQPHQLSLLLSLICTGIFSVLIFINYVCQVTFIPHLVSEYKPAYDFAIATFSMVNPRSLSWSIEMWGYAILGVATWLMAGYYKGKNKTIYGLLIANGVASLLSVILFTISAGWLLTTTGLVCYFVWNILMIVLLGLIFRNSKLPFTALNKNLS